MRLRKYKGQFQGQGFSHESRSMDNDQVRSRSVTPKKGVSTCIGSEVLNTT